MSNRLSREKSPYLLQHQENPVHWYAWGEEAFDAARNRDCPVFLSIGYATCHWCHVMARESFQDPGVAQLMNHAFVNIKVDREERPDIDHAYMRICQILTGQGGWPLNVLLTPDKRPFFAATYIPRESRFNRIGMLDLIPRIENAWKTERDKVNRTADRLVAGFRESLELETGSNGDPDERTVRLAVDRLHESFDKTWGGFGSAPKFPSPHLLTFLFTSRKLAGGEQNVDTACKTLERMRLGGLFDQVGYGFHRYSTDPEWKLPHFEKMLYDQAMLLIAYSDGWRISGDPLFLETIRQTARYLDQRLTSPEGLFYSAEDADSEGEEGLYYVWTHEEIHTLLNPPEAEELTRMCGINRDGNYRDEATGQPSGRNILWFRERPQEWSESVLKKQPLEESRLSRTLDTLHKVRENRLSPALDDKTLTDWNGLTIAALAYSGTVTNDTSLIERAQRCWSHLLNRMKQNNGRLFHRYRGGDAAIEGMADDYLFLQMAAIELHQATFELHYLSEALNLQKQMDHLFLDDQGGGYYFTAGDTEAPIGRQKQIFDGAMPSTNSVAAMNLVRLARLTGRRELEERAGAIFREFSSHLDRTPEHSAYAMQALVWLAGDSAEVVITTPKPNRESKQMVKLIRELLEDPHVILLKTENNREQLNGIAPFAKEMQIDSRPAAWVCRSFTCEQPARSADELKRILARNK